MIATAALCALLLQGQASTPAQGAKAPAVDSKQSKADLQHQKDLDGDTSVGKKAVIEVEKTEKLSDNKEYQDRVNRIGQEIAKIAQVTPVDVFWGDKRLNK